MMAAVSETILAAIRENFTPDQVSAVADLVASYGERPHEREVERVRMDIVKLSNGNMDAVRKLVGYAKRDYRDVITWAEYSKKKP